MRPTLVVVSGPPGSGKTRLAHAIAEAIACPAISRDEIKEGMVHSYGPGFEPGPGDPLTVRTYSLFFEVLRVLLMAGVSVVAEAAFQDRNWRRGLEPLSDLAILRIVHCTVDDAVARDRMSRRLASEPSRAAHADQALLKGIDAGSRTAPFERLSMTPSILVDTTDGYAPGLAEIVRFIERSDAREIDPDS